MDESEFGMLKSVAQQSALLIRAEGKSHQDGAGCGSKASKLVCVFVLRYGSTSLTDSGSPVSAGAAQIVLSFWLELVQRRYIKQTEFARSLWSGIGGEGCCGGVSGTSQRMQQWSSMVKTNNGINARDITEFLTRKV
jgi:hypothetical protein